jgi:hypothetical protein
MESMAYHVPPGKRMVASMTVRPPSESAPHPVVQWPGWVHWLGKNGWRHARCAGTQREVRARNYTALLETIRKAEGGARGGRRTEGD